MAQINFARRSFQIALPLFLTVSAVFLLASCSKPQSAAVLDNAVEIAAKDATFDAYRDKKIVIDLEPGNHNPQISWRTLYDMMPGEEPVADRNKAEEAAAAASAPMIPTDLKQLANVVKKWVGGKSTKKNFANWKDDPVALRAELDRKFTKQMRSILKQKSYKAEIIAAANAHGVDPILILACIVGENIFNVNGFDDAGEYAVRAKLMSNKWAIRFNANQVDLAELVKRPEFEECATPMRAGGTHAEYWDCVGAVWSKKFMGKFVDGVRYPNNGFKWTFFNPIGTGYSYGLGQLDPIRALMVTDQVNKKSGLALLTVERPYEIYDAVIDPKTTFHYVAANARLMIDRYMAGAGFNIGRNPGVIASLYNLGGEGKRASDLYKRNLVSLKAGKLTLPLENYYGFYMNEKESLMRQAFDLWSL